MAFLFCKGCGAGNLCVAREREWTNFYCMECGIDWKDIKDTNLIESKADWTAARRAPPSASKRPPDIGKRKQR